MAGDTTLVWGRCPLGWETEVGPRDSAWPPLVVLSAFWFLPLRLNTSPLLLAKALGGVPLSQTCGWRQIQSFKEREGLLLEGSQKQEAPGSQRPAVWLLLELCVGWV